VGAAIVAFGFKEASDPRLALGLVSVNGNRRTPAADVIAAAGFEPGANVWLLDVAAAQNRIADLPWVDSATVHRLWPNRVWVSVVERVPVARVWISTVSGEEPFAGLALVDATGRVLAFGSAQGAAAGAASQALPLMRIDPLPSPLRIGAPIPGDVFGQAYDALVQLRSLGLRVSEIDVGPVTGFTVTSDDGLRVILGTEDDLARKVTLFKAIVPKIAAPQNVVYVDLRSVRAPTVLYR